MILKKHILEHTAKECSYAGAANCELKRHMLTHAVNAHISEESNS